MSNMNRNVNGASEAVGEKGYVGIVVLRIKAGRWTATHQCWLSVKEKETGGRRGAWRRSRPVVSAARDKSNDAEVWRAGRSCRCPSRRLRSW